MKINPKTIAERKQKVETIAEEQGWLFQNYYPETFHIIFIKDDMKILVYLSTMTVATVLTHPIQGRGQLYRKGCNYQLVKQLFADPRTHSNKGYKFKKNKK